MPSSACRLASLADILRCGGHVRFTPKADMCGATRDVRYGLAGRSARLPLSFTPVLSEIISARTDDAARTEWAWRQWSRIAGPLAVVQSSCPLYPRKRNALHFFKDGQSLLSSQKKAMGGYWEDFHVVAPRASNGVLVFRNICQLVGACRSDRK